MADRIIEWFMDNVMGWFCIILILIMFLLIGWMGYAFITESKKETFSLIKSDWTCTQETTQLVPITSFIGKVPVTTMTYVHTCVQYNRIN